MIVSEPGATGAARAAAAHPDAPTIAAPRSAGDPPPRVAPRSSLRLFVERPATAVVLVRVGGDIDLATVPRLTEIVRHRLTAAVLNAVVVELTDVTFCGSAALELLLQSQHRVDQRGTTLYLVPGRAMGRLLDLTGLRERFIRCGNASEAVAAACAASG